jgi:hypothetical protein
MSGRKRYRRRPDHFVVAVRVDLDLGEEEGFSYRKWGGQQRCKQGDWLVDNDGDIYSVDADVFARTYRQTGPGTYLKSTPVWAEVAKSAGRVRTKEGSSGYEPGDYLVSNAEDGADEYCVSARKFEAMYELDK